MQAWLLSQGTLRRQRRRQYQDNNRKLDECRTFAPGHFPSRTLSPSPNHKPNPTITQILTLTLLTPLLTLTLTEQGRVNVRGELSRRAVRFPAGHAVGGL